MNSDVNLVDTIALRYAQVAQLLTGQGFKKVGLNVRPRL